MKSSEAIPLYIVRFMRLDDYPDEEYNYIRKSDAEKHFSMYATDNSGLYYEIQLSEVRNKTAKILNAKLLLPLSLTELHILKEYGTSDQLETCMALTRILRVFSSKYRIGLRKIAKAISNGTLIFGIV